MKIDFPIFSGKRDIEVFLGWIKNMRPILSKLGKTRNEVHSFLGQDEEIAEEEIPSSQLWTNFVQPISKLSTRNKKDN